MSLASSNALQTKWDSKMLERSIIASCPQARELAAAQGYRRKIIALPDKGRNLLLRKKPAKKRAAVWRKIAISRGFNRDGSIESVESQTGIKIANIVYR
ncbi:MAG: hypothetical protein CXZ00_02705 [Acidobacteria bacterium]|nr:MAG: hypothetical protein CXZ00_02705 [Acidobacteriota bacterium]